MTQNIIKLKNEKILLEYLYNKLLHGNIKEITSSEYFNFIEELVERINKDESEFKKEVTYKKQSFEEIVNNVNLLTKTYYADKNIKLSKDLITDQEIIIPTYGLTRINYHDYKSDLYGRQLDIYKELLKESIICDEICDFPLDKESDKKANIAKRVTSVFINDLIDRYVIYKISENRWPKQCQNVDEYIFKRDIASLIDENGTKQIFQKLYLHALSMTLKMISKINDLDMIKFSNNPNNVLAYANFYKMISPQEFDFIKQFVYDRYEINNSSINVTVNESKVTFKTITCSNSDEYEYDDDTYDIKEGNVSDKQVKIMEKRIKNNMR